MAEHYPNLHPNGSLNSDRPNTIISNIQDSVTSSVDDISHWQTVQNITHGPMAEKARAEADNTRQEFSNLAASRQTPQSQTINGQALTHYHSFFYNLLSWENPRATSLTYVAIVSFIFVLRYVPVFRYVLRVMYLLLGLTAGAELIGKFAVGHGFASKMRPRRYYTIPRETLESILADVEELINFFVIEFQRIVFAENVYATVGAFSTAFVTYWLIRFMPPWGLALFFTTVIFFTPLTYIQHREVIDQRIADAQKIVNDQTVQIRDLATQHTNKAVEMGSNAFQEYSAKAQELIGSGKKAAVEKNIVSPQTAEKIVPEKSLNGNHNGNHNGNLNGNSFPAAPTSEPLIKTEVVPVVETEAEPVIKPEPLVA